VPGQPQHLQQEDHGEHDPEHGQDRARAEANEALLDHGGRIAQAPDVYSREHVDTLPPISLRGSAVERRATLPDGRTVIVRIGLAPDSYVPARELDTVSLELILEGEVTASLNTILDPSQDSEARALARRIAEGLESGSLEPTAGALESLITERP